MRFLRGFNDLQIIKWSDHYVQYRLLRTLIRTTPVHVARTGQQEDQKRVAAFHSKIVDLLNRQVDCLIEEFNIPTFSDYEKQQAFCHTLAQEEHALLELVELRKSIEELRWFEYVNEQAFRLLWRKLERKALRQNASHVPQGVHSLFQTRTDRIRLSEWVERAIKFTEESLSQATSHLTKDLRATLGLVSSLRDSDSRREYAHRLVRKFGCRTARKATSSISNITPNATTFVEYDVGLDVELSKIFSYPEMIAHSVLQELDGFQRLPLYYAVYYGMVKTVETISNRMQHVRTPTFGNGNPFTSEDCLGHSVLHMAVFRGYTTILQFLLRKMIDLNDPHSSSLRQSNLTILAMRRKSSVTIELLIQHGIGIDHHDIEGRSVFHYAAQAGQDRVLSMLISRFDDSNFDETDKNGLSPLMYASIDGNIGAVQLLLDKGADPCRQDIRGWTAKEYAAHRGHIKLAYILHKLSPLVTIPDETRTAVPDGDRSSQEMTASPANTQYDLEAGNSKSVSKSHTTVIINMGSLDSRKAYVDLKLLTTTAKLGLAIELSAVGDLTHSIQQVIHLPILESTINSPYVISTRDLSTFQLVFRILDVKSLDNPKQQPKVLGTAVALAQTLRLGLGQHRESLTREATVPVMDQSHQVLGTLTFWFLIVTPFTSTKISATPQRLHRIMEESSIIGHRGNGQNARMQDRPRVQVGENTMQSFTSAHGLGVHMVEFDVQMTADLVPLVYHDYLVSETGTDAPVHVVTLDQFRHISRSQQTRETRSSATEQHYQPKIRAERRLRARTLSMDSCGECCTSNIADRVKETWQFKKMGFKGNIRGNYVQEPINTLEEVLKELPTTLGFNIELKYPMLFEADLWHMPPYNIEINTYIDKILELCFTLGGDRKIMLSSFCPEICIALKLKQSTYPVVFVSDGGLLPTGDLRASNFQEAVHFARRWNLDGVAMMADPFVISHRLVEYVKQAGLFTMSHGGLNNDSEHVKTQAENGVESFIVDDIVRISRSLKEHHRERERTRDSVIEGSGDCGSLA